MHCRFGAQFPQRERPHSPTVHYITGGVEEEGGHVMIHLPCGSLGEGVREGETEGGREGKREGETEGGREGKREGKRESVGGREGEREGGREGK